MNLAPLCRKTQRSPYSRSWKGSDSCSGSCLHGDGSRLEIARGIEVKSFSLHDRVVANLGMKLGGHAQYAALKEKSPTVRIPSNISYEDAAAVVFGGTTALCFLRDKLKIRKGERLLVIGAGGSVGSAAVQIGKIFGAHVTGVCSTSKVSAVQSLGADRVIDYKKTDWRKEAEVYDLILDAVGGTELSNSSHKLSTTGKIGLVVADLPLTLKAAGLALFKRQKMYAGPIAETSSDLEQLLAWMSEGKFKLIIGDRFPLEKIVQAHEWVDQGRKTGNTVITFI